MSDDGRMNEIAAGYWRERGARVEDGRVRRFGEAGREALAMFEAGCLLVPLLGVAGLEVSGPDALPFIQGQLSNDVSGMRAGGSLRALQLNVRGQVVAEATVCRRPTELFLAVEDGAGPALKRSLAEHIVFDDVRLADRSQHLTSFTLQGPEAAPVVAAAIGAPPQTGAFVEHAWVEREAGPATALVIERDRSGRGGFDVHVAVDALPGVVEAVLAAGAELAGERALTSARVRAGLPTAAGEASVGVLPQEAGLEPLVSYRKGCYLGQEIMARIEARGTVRRGLARLRIEGGAPAVDALEDADDSVLRVADKPVGMLGSVAFDPEAGASALAVLRTDVADDSSIVVAGFRARLDARLRWDVPDAATQAGPG